MSFEYDWWFDEQRAPLPTLEEIFEKWVAFGGDSTLEEFTLAYLSTVR